MLWLPHSYIRSYVYVLLCCLVFLLESVFQDMKIKPTQPLIVELGTIITHFNAHCWSMYTDPAAHVNDLFLSINVNYLYNV